MNQKLVAQKCGAAQRAYWFGDTPRGISDFHLQATVKRLDMNAGLNSILLSTKEKDSSAVFEIAFSYGLYQMTWDELHKALLSRSSDGLIGKDGFASFFQDRSDGQDEWSTTRSELEERVMGIFDCFDRTGSDFCDVDELTCGLSLFIRG